MTRRSKGQFKFPNDRPAGFASTGLLLIVFMPESQHPGPGVAVRQAAVR